MSPRKVNANDVLAAIEEHKKLGREKFLEKYGFSTATKYLLNHEGEFYDSKAIYGAARIGAGHPKDEIIRGGIKDAVKLLEELGFSIVPKQNYWWVSHRNTAKHAMKDGFIWAPLKTEGGQVRHSHQTMKQVQSGDIIFSFHEAKIQAVGVCTAPAILSQRPNEYRPRDGDWQDNGWKVPVQFEKLEHSLRPKDHMDVLSDRLPKKHSPIQKNGNGNQGVYLSLVPKEMAKELIKLLGADWQALKLGSVQFETSDECIKEEQEAEFENEIRNRTDIGATEKLQLTRSRRGQGIYRKNLQQFESSCRVTGTTNLKHLRASHIKPWRSSSDFEKLDGNNGLLLAPHIDHLFDQGYISFDDDGRILFSEELDHEIQDRWHIAHPQKGEAFRAKQIPYLTHHRNEIFRGRKM